MPGLRPLSGAALAAALRRQLRHGGPRASLAALGLLLAGLALTAVLSMGSAEQAERDALAQFDRLAGRIEREIERRLLQPIYGLKGARGVYAASDEVSRIDFRNYVDSRQLAQEFPGIRGFGFIERVPRPHLDRFLVQARADGMPDFQVRTSGQWADLYVIKYLEPLSDNLAALGYDLGQEPLRREAIERAVLTGEDTMSGRISLLQDEAKRPGFMLMVPVYRRGADPQTEGQRLRALVGVVYAPVVADELLGRVAEVGEQLLDFRLLADDGPQAQDLLFASATGAANEARAARPSLEQERRIDFAGKRLRLQLVSTPAFEQRVHRGAPLWIAVSGAGLSLSLAFATWLLISGRLRAEALAAARTADLARALGENRSLLETVHQHSIVSVTDVAGTIIDVNEAFCRISGYSREELLGANHRLINSGQHGPEFWRGVWAELLAGRSWRGELCNMAKSGQLYWVDSIIAPIFDAQGRIEKYISIRSDISAAKRAALRLLNNQVVLDRAERLAGLGAWELAVDTQKLSWSDQTYRLHDVPLGTEVTLDLALSHLSDSGRRALQDAVHQAASGRAWDLELSLRTGTGRELWVRSVGEASFDDQGALRIFGTYQDITQRRALEAQTRQANQVLRSVLENLPCALSVFDADLNLLAHNGQFRRLLEFPDELFAGPNTTFEQIIRFNAARGEYGEAEDVEATVQQIIERARHPSLHQFERTRPNGRTLEVRGAPMPDGGFVTTYVDISERKRAEAEVRRAEALLRGSIDAVNEGFVLYDPEDRLVFCNEKYRQMYPRSADLIVPGASFESIVRGGAERGQYVEAIGRVEEWVAERMAAHRVAQATLVQKLDDERWVRVIERRMDDGHLVGFRIDITDLMRATEEAQSASRAKSQFLANMSHEIRTPMNAILGMLKLLQKTPLSERQQDYASKTEGAARSLLGLLNDILDFSKVEAGKMTLDPQPFRLEPLFRELSVILSANLGAKPVELLFDLDPGLPAQLLGDALRLQQVLINLGGNALKFTPQGEVVLGLRLQALTQDRAKLEFSVRDSGIGIAPEHQAQIFSGFTQAEASTTRRFGGTGLGLAISQRLVQLMGGELRLDSAPGRGSHFSFNLQLPVLPPDAEAAGGPAAARVLRALIVDDHEEARAVLARMATALGWTVLQADRGEAALLQLQQAAAQGQALDLVLLDGQMPGQDALACARRMRELQQGLRVLLMVSAHGREQLGQRSAADAELLEDCLVKPLTPGMLADAGHGADAAPRAGAAPQATAALPLLPRSDPPSQALQGLRLLVVEDNLNNQQVAQELLEDAGARVSLAEHGQRAVELLRERPRDFDLVLMDVQMPVMDGYTATRWIREQLGLRELPIVAMTANAMASDRAECLAAGMNEHVGKPFDLEPLTRLILQLCAPARAPGAQADAPVSAADPVAAAEPVAASRKPRSFPTLAVPAELRQRALAQGIELQSAMDRFMGKISLFQRMAQTFGPSAEDLQAQLRQALSDGDAAAAGMALHSLKGLAATLGAQALAALGAEGEERLKRGESLDPDWLQGLAQQLERGSADLRQLADELARHAQAAAAPGAAAVAPEAVAVDGATVPPAAAEAAFAAELAQLRQMLRDFDMAATDTLNQMLQTHASRFAAVRDPLEAAVMALDFERALALTDGLLPAPGLAEGAAR
ncbi:hypothetical protein C1O66_00390 [Paucibacter aquatile]|uniref:Sensory/regulatory protein RpfC n=1 Tax=Kinneretia aquatilis TaxID=2070761 RepID=A0A2N8L2I2_9BURK|nr:PAS-domain containing protein [Paucibacter aquatile]PND39909.1 hypothetical protein C1O66_00390 [Paucibacter aquatile]